MGLLSVKKLVMLPKYGYMHTEISIVMYNGIIQMKLYNYRAAIIYHIAGYFQRVLIFGYFEEAFFCKNKFPGPTVIPEYILTIK